MATSQRKHRAMPSHPRSHPMAIAPLLLFLAAMLGANDPSSLPSTSSGVDGRDLTCPAYDASKVPASLAPAPAPAAGALAGSFAVSQGGQATYTFPLIVPPGATSASERGRVL